MIYFVFSYKFYFPFQAKPASEYERPITPEIEPQIEPVVPVIEHESITQPPPSIEHKVQIHLEPRPATIEPVDVQSEPARIVVPLTRKSEDKTVTKKSVIVDLHGAAVDLPAIELVTPGPLPTLAIGKKMKTIKIKKSTGGLCASCFGAKSANKKKKEIVSEPVQAPIEPQKSIENEEKKDLTPISEAPATPATTPDEPILPRVNIDIFKDRTFQKSTEVK